MKNALNYLHDAGYEYGSIGVYMLIGLPEQTDEEILASAQYIHACGGHIYTAQYSPIPGTTLFEKTRAYDARIEYEPLLHNSSIAPGWGYDLTRYDYIKSYVREYNRQL